MLEGVRKMKKKHIGSSFEDFLREEGIFDEVQDIAEQRKRKAGSDESEKEEASKEAKEAKTQGRGQAERSAGEGRINGGADEGDALTDGHEKNVANPKS
jgi:hypothetical protein